VHQHVFAATSLPHNPLTKLSGWVYC
jgi:hypothetical protein